MNKGDKVICIKDYNDSGWLSKNDSVTKGQLYEVSSKRRIHSLHTITGDKVICINVEGKGNVKYPTNLFITVEQHRENQINQILI